MDYKIKSRLWVETNNNVLLGEGRVRLLKAIQETGSLSKAAKDQKMSYKKAWTMVNSVNKSAKHPIIETSIGGKGGGGATLTTYGIKLIAVFEEINKNCWDFLDQELAKFNDL